MKQYAYVCFNGHVVPIPKRKLKTADGKRCPVCDEACYIKEVEVGIDLSSGPDTTSVCHKWVG